MGVQCRVAPNEQLSAFVHGLRGRLLDEIRAMPGAVIPKTCDSILRTPYDKLPEAYKASSREAAIQIQRIFIGDDDDDERPSQEKAKHGKA
jgi:hypothetical protein